MIFCQKQEANQVAGNGILGELWRKRNLKRYF